MEREREREREKRERLIYFKELAHEIAGLTNLKSAGQVRQAGNSGRSKPFSLESKDSLEAKFLLLGILIFSFKTLTDCIRPTHIIKGNLLYSKTTDLNVNHI